MSDTKSTIDRVYRYLLNEVFVKLEDSEIEEKKGEAYVEPLYSLFKTGEESTEYMQHPYAFEKRMSYLLRQNSAVVLFKQDANEYYNFDYLIIVLNSKNNSQSIFFYISVTTSKREGFTSSSIEDYGIFKHETIYQKIKKYNFLPAYDNFIQFRHFSKKSYESNPKLYPLFSKRSSPSRIQSPVNKTRSSDDILEIQKFYQYVVAEIDKKEKEIIEGPVAKSYFDLVRGICKKNENVFRIKPKTKEEILDKIKELMEEDIVIFLNGYETRPILGEDDVWRKEEFLSSAFCIIVATKGSSTPILFIKSRDDVYIKMHSGVHSKTRILELVEDMGIMRIPEKIYFLFFHKKRFADCPEIQNEKSNYSSPKKKPSALKKKEEPLLFNPEYNCMERASYGRRNVYSKEDLVKIAMTLKLFRTRSEASRMTKPELCKYIKASISLDK